MPQETVLGIFKTKMIFVVIDVTLMPNISAQVKLAEQIITYRKLGRSYTE